MYLQAENPLSKPIRLEDIDRVAHDAFQRVHTQIRPCLWPKEFAEGSAENAWRFLKLLQTWNEAAGEEQAFPDLPYLEEFVHEWWDAQSLGKMLVVEKCRRMVITWADRGLTLYRMGLHRTDWLLAGEDYEKATSHVWRLAHYYENLQARLLRGDERLKAYDWNLPSIHKIRFQGSRYLKQVTLPNGSICKAINSDPESVRGDGVAGITFEEGSTYRELSSMVAQAKIICQNAAGERKGFICVIANASPHEDWQRIKTGGKKL